MVLLLTTSAFQAGLVVGLSAVPFLVLSLPVGGLVDRIPRRLVLITSSSVSMLARASIAASFWCGSSPPPSSIRSRSSTGARLCCSSSPNSAYYRSSCRERPAATSLAQTVERLAAILGPPLGTYLFFSSSAETPFAINAVSFAAITLAVLRIRSASRPLS
ncbi:MFS transporter [Mycolicibacterium sp. YH-1]|uniref:MFS transporter n=1 Tax=Mycolicibacterium sp. YH-1 TaxID=2908837 RepID=UPI00352F34F3